jgi:predicted ATPase
LTKSGFQHLKVDGFRRLCGVDCELRPLTVMIGANGSGKTSLLEVMSLLAASAQGRLRDKFNELGGIAAVLTAGRQNLFCSLIEASQEGSFSYSFAISPLGIGYVIEEEGLLRPDGVTEALDIHPASKVALETGLSQISRPSAPAGRFRQQLASSTLYHNLDVGPRSPVRVPQPIRPAELPGKDGEDLVTCLYQMRELDPDRYEAVEDALRAAFPSFEKLKFPSVAGGTLAMIWLDANFPSGFYSHQLSEGVLRFLWLTTLLQSPALPSVTLLDEPEVSLHPELLNLLAHQLREAAQRSQIIVATHSDRLIRFLKPEEVLITDLTEEGLAKFSWADSLDLEKWLTEYTLDEVWSIGRLGGRA